MGKKVAAGGFGTVFTADLVEPDSGDRRWVMGTRVADGGWKWGWGWW